MRAGVRIPVFLDLASVTRSEAVVTFWVKLPGPFTDPRLANIKNGLVANEKILLSVDCAKNLEAITQAVVEWPDGTTTAGPMNEPDKAFSAIVPDSWVDTLHSIVCSSSHTTPAKPGKVPR